MKYFAIGDEDTVLGFGMAGVEGRIARNSDEASAAFREALSTSDIGIVIMTERTAETIRPEVDEYVFSERFPLLVEIPDRKGRLPGLPGVRELANAAIGVKI
ncbi:MAG: Vacuolar H+transporting two-sector ATPase F subunit [Spirochaetales bacterium]|nr:MAG: Vacuolar H+transporting two-sector ATPase F subunit [Spirochaetales bacterium]